MNKQSKGKGGDRHRGIPAFYDELKRDRKVSLTDTAWQVAGDRAQQQGISRSEFIERLLRSLNQEE